MASTTPPAVRWRQARCSGTFSKRRHACSNKDELRDALHAAADVGVPEQDIVTASVFTTQSATADLEKIRDQIKAAPPPAPADFNLGPGGTRTVFSLENVKNISWRQHTQVNPPGFSSDGLDLSRLQIIPGAVGEIAFWRRLGGARLHRG